MVCDKVVCLCECVWSYGMWVWSDSMLNLCVWRLLYVKFVCVKLWYVRDGMWQSCVCVSVCEVICMLNLCVWSYGMWVSAGGGGRRRSPGYRIKNKNPTQSCGEKTWAKRACHDDKDIHELLPLARGKQMHDLSEFKSIGLQHHVKRWFQMMESRHDHANMNKGGGLTIGYLYVHVCIYIYTLHCLASNCLALYICKHVMMTCSWQFHWFPWILVI